MTAHRRGLPLMPLRVKRLPVDARGYPVPWFVKYIDGVPDFRVADRAKFDRAMRLRYCWICGTSIGRTGTFVIGPMCAVNRISGEPPSHKDCAEFSAVACPHLNQPTAGRRDAGLDKIPHNEGAGIMLKHNPGVCLVWTSRTWLPFKTGGGYLFDIGEPVSFAFYARGRIATPEEVRQGFAIGLPKLREVAAQEGPASIAELDKLMAKARTLFAEEMAP